MNEAEIILSTLAGEWGFVWAKVSLDYPASYANLSLKPRCFYAWDLLTSRS